VGLGTQQGARQFITGRSSDGVQVAYPLDWTSSVTLMPYAGLYGDYYFNNDNLPALAGVVPLALRPFFPAGRPAPPQASARGSPMASRR